MAKKSFKCKLGLKSCTFCDKAQLYEGTCSNAQFGSFMDLLNSPGEDLLNRFKAEGKLIKVDPVKRDKAISDINNKIQDPGLKYWRGI